MTTLASDILDFILGLFDDPEKAQAFAEDPEAALAEAGLPGVAPAEVQDLMPMVSGYAPGGWHGKPSHDDDHHRPIRSDRCDDDDDKPVVKPVGCDDDDKPVVKPVACDDDDDHKPVGKPHHDDHHGHGHHGHHGHHGPVVGHETTVIAHVTNIQNNITNNITHVNVQIDASHGIWVEGDVYNIFGGHGDDTIALPGGVAVGDGAEVEAPIVIGAGGVAVDGDNEGAIVTGGGLAVDGDIEDNNIGNSGDVIEDSIVVQDVNVAVGNLGPVAQDTTTTTTTTTIGSGNSGNAQTAIGDDSQAGDSVDVEVEVEDSAIALGGDANSGHQEDSQNDLSVGPITYAPDYSEDNDTLTVEDVAVVVDSPGSVVGGEEAEVEVEVEDPFVLVIEDAPVLVAAEPAAG